jgi:hypothetical protein
MLIIGFGHRARNGKDTAVNALLDYYARRSFAFFKHGFSNFRQIIAQRIGFADALYKMAREEYGMTEKDAPLLQRLGSEKRAVDPEYWVKRAFATIKPDTDIVLISDVRYRNEADYIKARGGFVIDVQRLNLDGTPWIATDRPADHPSEIDLDGYNFDYYIKVKTGNVALVGDLAITHVEHIRRIMEP